MKHAIDSLLENFGDPVDPNQDLYLPLSTAYEAFYQLCRTLRINHDALGCFPDYLDSVFTIADLGASLFGRLFSTQLAWNPANFITLAPD